MDQEEKLSLLEDLYERKIIPRNPYLSDEEIKDAVLQVLVKEGDGNLGRRLYDFACMVDFDFNALEPLLNRNPHFLSEMEGITHLEFYALRAQTLYSKQIVSALDSIRLLLTKEIVVKEGMVDKKEWEGIKGTSIVESNVTDFSVRGKKDIVRPSESEEKIDFGFGNE